MFRFNGEKYFQFIRDDADAVLGGFRASGLGLVRTGRHQDLHPVLGHAHVRYLRRHQRHRSPQPANCHDESFLPTDFGQWIILSFLLYKRSVLTFSLFIIVTLVIKT
jgi:hypothetical protein